ncbi:hypothetical protein BDW42DRAFT_3212 [Aspergillus taichungensis]|uniref:Uncharacterized protein n=1 Tax=Aspergillus taichungensis TaxID=482145 RepID=A0A2J5I606_9EURO|nr:hypothetical protein BDW42DRAFT_3212 [Aspergillus taichungensis]
MLSRSSSDLVKPYKYVDICQSQSSASLCDLTVGRLRIDCCFLMSKMRWGQLRDQDSGLMYLDLTFHQPVDCKLAQATITLSFQSIQQSSSSMSPLEVTEFFGPQALSGEKRERQVSNAFEATPKFGAASTSVEGIGMSRRSEVNYASRWKFTGTRFAADTSNDSFTRSSQYRQLVWHLEENELERQAVHHSIVHTALAFHHNSSPFYLDVQVEVKMRRWRHRLQQRLVCPPRGRKAITRAKIEPPPDKFADPQFPQLARDLNQALTEENLHPVVEVSDPKPAATLADDSQDKDPDTEVESRSLPDEALLALARQLTGQEPPSVSTAPKSSLGLPTQTAESSSATLVGSTASLNEIDDQTETKSAIPDAGDSLISVPAAEVAKTKAIRDNGLYIVLAVTRQTLQLLEVTIAWLILGLGRLHSVLAQAKK